MTNEPPRITVLMPVFNCEAFVGEAIESILDQSFGDFEFLIIDDASTDNTREIIKSYQDPRITLIEKAHNTGYTRSLNHGLSIAKGEYIARMDGDDISLPERFLRQLEFMDSHPDVVVCGTNFGFVGKDGAKNQPIQHEDIKIKLLNKTALGHPTTMIRKKVLFENGIVYDVEKEPAEDYAMWVFLLRVGKLHNLKEVLFKYRQHNNQVSFKRQNISQRMKTMIRIEILQFIDFRPTLEQRRLLTKAFNRLSVLTYNEITKFDLLCDTLIENNKNEFFKAEQFIAYLKAQQDLIIRDFFINRSTYSPSIILNYFKLKSKFNMPKLKFSSLVVKSLIFHKNLNSKFYNN